jgi:hypothetical protein
MARSICFTCWSTKVCALTVAPMWATTDGTFSSNHWLKSTGPLEP